MLGASPCIMPVSIRSKPTTWRGCDEAQVVLHLLDVLADQVRHHGEVLVQQAAAEARQRAAQLGLDKLCFGKGVSP